MASESWLWKQLKPLYPEGHFTRHEDRAKKGISDVSYGLARVNGFIELKGYASWPKEPTTIVPFANVKKVQIRFLEKRGHAGGHCFLMAVFGKDEFILINHMYLDGVGTTCKKDLMYYVCFHHKGKLAERKDELKEILTRPYF